MSHLTNFQKWRIFTDGFISPDSFIDWGFYYLISASLQRRVWIGSHVKLYPNVYTILVGDPATGKGLVTRQVGKILNFHKLDPADFNKADLPSGLTAEEQRAAETILQRNFEEAEKREGLRGKRIVDKPPVIPVGANSTTYEALVSALAGSLRFINYSDYDKSTQKQVMRTYMHSSLCFCLEEIASLFRKRTEDVVKFLLETYDCTDYSYDTKTPGLKEYVKRSCLNLLGGTQPDFMQEIFNDRLITDGFASRCFFIYAHKPRKVSFFIPDLNAEQEQYFIDILAHVKKLTRLYGKITLTPETEAFLNDWWIEAQTKRPNISYRLNHYYGRKNLHVQKLMMALHFGESTDMTIGVDIAKRAIEILAKEEKKMHYALGIDNNNPLAAPMQRIKRYIRDNPRKTKRELMAEFFEALPNRPSVEENLTTILEHLVLTGKVLKVENKNPVTMQYAKYVYTCIEEEEIKKEIGEL